MCYHTSIPSKKKLEKELPQYQVSLDIDAYYHVSGFSRPFLPVTTNSNLRTIETAQWKLLPFWVKNEEDAKKYANTCNAVSEEVFTKGTYKHYIERHRGLLWVDGFYEPHKNTKGESENYYIYLPEKRIFSIGIVVAPWLNEDTGEIINTFSVLTTKANPLMEKIHNEKKRMPLIIAPDDRDSWLEAHGKSQIQSFFKPFNGLLEAHKVYRVTADRTGNTNREDIQYKID
jgi:putative SOS response-associated peptidase YedK